MRGRMSQVTDKMREDMIVLLTRGQTVSQVAEALGMSSSTIYRYAQGRFDHLLSENQRKRLKYARERFYYER